MSGHNECECKHCLERPSVLAKRYKQALEKLENYYGNVERAIGLSLTINEMQNYNIVKEALRERE